MPFIETALIGDGTDENLLHFGSVRFRVTGSGNLNISLFSLDKVRSFVAKEMVMSEATSNEPTRLTNFISQRALLRLDTDFINETFNVSRIVVYVKGTYTQGPN